MPIDPRELMGMPQDELPDPPSLPGGKHFYAQIMRYEQGPTPWDKETTAVFYHVQLTEPGEDVTPEEVDGINLREYSLNPKAYVITPERVWEIKALHKSMALTGSIEQNVVDSVGKRVLCGVNAKLVNGRTFNNITTMVGAE